MAQQEAKIIWEKYKAGKASPEEVQLVLNWFHSLHAEDAFDFDPEELEQLHAEMLRHVGQHIRAKPKPATVKLWWGRGTAWKVAAAVAVITLGVWLYNISNTSRHSDAGQNPGLAMNDIAPGRNTAALTLASGEVINLDTNKTSVVVTDSVKTFVMLTASTPRGGTYQVTLPDGTKAWLNAASTIKFPSSFAGAKQRRIEMTGEVYLEVARDKKHPFIVKTAALDGRPGQQVEVLGTHFNINAYPEEGETRTTLLEGSVSVSSLRGRTAEQRAATILKPNQQSVLTAGERITVKEVNPAEVIDWKNGNFVFRDQPLEELMLSVARWYDLEIIYAPGAPRDVPLSGMVSRSRPLSGILEGIQATAKVKFKIEGKKLYIDK